MAEMKGPSLWALTQGTFQKGDLELLKTGLLADAQVECGSRTWNVHKVILCTRSKWFKKALLGPFEEGQTGKVTLTAFTEDEVDCLLRFLYVGSVDFKKAFPNLTILVAIFRAWKLADFFCLDILHDLLTQALNNETRRIAKNLCDPLEEEIDVNSNVEDEVLPAIRAIYQDDVAAVKDIIMRPMLGLVIATMHRLQPRADFQSLFREIPEFSVDWSTAFMGGMDAGLPDLDGRRWQCGYCNSIVRKNNGFVDGFKWIKHRKVYLVCSECFEVPALSGWEESESESS